MSQTERKLDEPEVVDLPEVDKREKISEKLYHEMFALDASTLKVPVQMQDKIPWMHDGFHEKLHPWFNPKFCGKSPVSTVIYIASSVITKS
jgi:hypothetical protein